MGLVRREYAHKTGNIDPLEDFIYRRNTGSWHFRRLGRHEFLSGSLYRREGGSGELDDDHAILHVFWSTGKICLLVHIRISQRLRGTGCQCDGSQTDGKYLVDVHILNLLFIIYKVRSI